MSNELWASYGSGGDDIYAIVRNAAGEVWYPTGSAFEAHGTDGHDNDDYDITMTDKESGFYVCDMPAAAEGRYVYQVYEQAGESPDNGDTAVASGQIEWSGTAERHVMDWLTAILLDTNELQEDWKDTGRLDTILDSILADTGELQEDWANDGRLDAILDLILADTGELQEDWADDGRLDAILDLIYADTNELQGDWKNGGRLDELIDGIITDMAALVLAEYNIVNLYDERTD